MEILAVGGTGFVGQALVPYLQYQGHQVTILTRESRTVYKVFGHEQPALAWEQLIRDPSRISDYQVIINLAGANLGRWPWTNSYKQQILNSRIWTTNKLAEACAQQNNPPVLLNTSAVGIYGLQTNQAQGLPEAYDEQTELDFDNPPDFLAKVGREWEQATEPAKQAGVRVVNMRFGIVIGPGGGVFQMLKLPFYFYMGGQIGSGTQPFSWIALTDLLRAIDFLINHEDIAGPVNLVANGCVTQQHLAHAIGERMHRPAWFYTPAWLMKLFLGEMAETLLLHGQHVKPTRLMEHQFEFCYPTIEKAVAYAQGKE